MLAVIIKTIIRILAWIPLPVNRLLGALIGRLFYWKNGREARIARINLTACFPEKTTEEIERIVRGRLKNLGQMITETGSIWLRPAEYWLGTIKKIEGTEKLYGEDKEKPQGVLLLIPHAGNWELAGKFAANLHTVCALYKPPKMVALDPLLRMGRIAGKTTLLPADRSGVLAVFKALQKGEMTLLLPDQEPDRAGGRFAPFFGRPALTMTLVYKLIQKTECKVVMGFAKRISGGFELHYLDPDKRIYSSDEQESLIGLNASVEAIARLELDQYQWEYKRFRTAPEGKPKLYTPLKE